MADRDMSYALDGVFSTRNQGQLISSTPVQSRMVRAPGLQSLKIRPTSRPIPGQLSGMGRPADGLVQQALSMLGADVSVPVFGTMSMGMAVAGVAVAWFMLRRK